MQPTFPITIRAWQRTAGAPVPPVGAPDFTCPAELRAMFTGNAYPVTSILMYMLLMVPAGTDLRPQAGWHGANVTIVECPAFTGRYYQCQGVDDSGKGTSREYRFAIVEQRSPVPFPIP